MIQPWTIANARHVPAGKLPRGIHASQTASTSTTPVSAESAAQTRHDRLTHEAQKWIATTFYGQMLKQMRESPFKSEIFDGGRGGQAFSSMYDQQLADHMSRSTGDKLVRSIVRKLEGRTQSAVGGASGEDGINGPGINRAAAPVGPVDTGNRSNRDGSHNLNNGAAPSPGKDFTAPLMRRDSPFQRQTPDSGKWRPHVTADIRA